MRVLKLLQIRISSLAQHDGDKESDADHGAGADIDGNDATVQEIGGDDECGEP